jgi:putative acetyltransferase
MIISRQIHGNVSTERKCFSVMILGKNDFISYEHVLPKPMIKILPETRNDHKAIRDVNELAFGQMNEALLIGKLRQHDDFRPGLSLVAKDGVMIVGHILLFPVKIVGPRKSWPSLSLGPMAVIPEYQNMGIGGLLVNKGLDEASSAGFTNVNVLGHPRYYPRFGFQKASLFGIVSPFAAPDEAVMIIELKKDALKGVKGIITYPPEYFTV